MDIFEFEQKLRELIGDPTTLRPFVCHGSPLTCEAFIIGVNAATTMKANWWDFWDHGTGFNKTKWEKQYRAERSTRKTKTGRAKKEVSPTRERIERVVAAALEGTLPLRCLETNVFSVPSEKIADLDAKQTEVFEFLVDAIRPRIVLAYGKDALNVLGSNRPFKIETEDHLRLITYDDAGALGRRLNELWCGL